MGVTQKEGPGAGECKALLLGFSTLSDIYERGTFGWFMGVVEDL